MPVSRYTLLFILIKSLIFWCENDVRFPFLSPVIISLPRIFFICNGNNFPFPLMESKKMSMKNLYIFLSLHVLLVRNMTMVDSHFYEVVICLLQRFKANILRSYNFLFIQFSEPFVGLNL